MGRLSPAPLLALLGCLTLGACNGGTPKAKLYDAIVPQSLRGGLTVSGPEALEAFQQWRDALATEVILPVSIQYSLNANFERQNPETKEVTHGKAVGNFHYQGIDTNRSRLDAFLVLGLPDSKSDWDLTGTMLCDGFYLRSWGTANGVPGVDPDKTYAVQFQQSAFESTYASIMSLMPKFLDELDSYGISSSAFFRSNLESPVHAFHPQYFLDLTHTALACHSLRFADNRIYCKLGLDLSEGSPLYSAFQLLLDAPEKALLMVWANTTLVDAVFEARTGVLIGLKFDATYPPGAALTNAPLTKIHFTLESSDLEWSIADLDRALDRPDIRTIDLTAMLTIAGKFLRETENQLDAADDTDF